MIGENTTAAQRALDFTGRLINDHGPRPAGSDSARAAADALKSEAGQFADKTWSEDFQVHPGAFLGWIRLLVIFYVAAVSLLWLALFLPAALLTTLGLAIMVAEFFYYREFIDFLYPKRNGRNVLAVVEPQQEARGQLIISGHHDSAPVFNFLVHQPNLYSLRVTGGIAVFVLLTLLSWLLTIWTAAAGQAPGWTSWVAGIFTFLLLLLVQLWWFASSKHAPGAGDNLASTAAAWEALREVAGWKANEDGLQYLRVIAASWDAEEAGLRGVRRWAQNGSDGRLDLPAWNLNLECLYDRDELFFLTSDVNGTVSLSDSMVQRCQRLLAERGQEVPAQPIAFLTGGTDAGELARVGVQATTLIGMPWGNDERSSVYHTPGDVLDTVSPDAVADAIRLGLALARDLDGELANSAE